MTPAEKWALLAIEARELAEQARKDGWVQPPLPPAPDWWNDHIEWCFAPCKSDFFAPEDE